MTNGNFGLALAAKKSALRDMTIPYRNRNLARGLFFGDPIELTSSDVSDALVDPNKVREVVENALVASKSSDLDAATRLQAYDSMSVVEKAAITKVPPLAVWNAQVIVDPVLGRILSSNLNYTLQKALIDLPFEGFVKTSQLSAPGALECQLTAADLSVGAGYKSLPFFRFVISASTLNARPGGNYSIRLEGVADSGALVSTPTYSFQRRNAVEAVVGVFIPFSVIATRALPVLPIFGTDGTTPRVIKIIVDGMTLDEVLTVTVPGYATAEMREIATMYNLPAGVIM